MSTPFYDLASLVVVPSGYKASKVYAQKPLTTDGQLTFSRASTATRVNSAGLIETVSSNVPRLDYTNSTCPRLLLEPQRTQSIRNSSMAGAVAGSPGTLPTAWTRGGVISGITQTIVGIGTENGLPYIDLRYNGTANSTFGDILFEGANIISSANAATWTESAYIKFIAAPNPPLSTNFAFRQFNSAATFLGVTIGSALSVSSSLTRHSNAFTTNQATVAFVQPSLFFYFTNGAAYDFTIRIAAPQMELGSYATSWVPTTTAAVTRLADACNKTGISSLIGQTEGTLFVEVDYSTLSGLNMFLSIRPNSSNKVEIYRDGANIYGEINGSSNFAIFTSKAVGTHKIAFAYKSGSSALYIDGALVNQNTTSFTFSATLADLFINQRSGGTFIEAANYKQALLFKTRLPNAQLAELTQL